MFDVELLHSMALASLSGVRLPVLSSALLFVAAVCAAGMVHAHRECLCIQGSLLVDVGCQGALMQQFHMQIGSAAVVA